MKVLEPRLQMTLHWFLKIAVCMEFVGHGAFGVMTKEAWLPYIQLWGIPVNVAWVMMPIVGSIDVTMGLYTLLFPRRWAFAYMALWGFFTATLRPLTGESIFELVERSYNYGMPLAFLFLHGFGTDWKSWTERVKPLARTGRAFPEKLAPLFRAIVVLMLIGHGGYGAFANKTGLMNQYINLDLSGRTGVAPFAILHAIGYLEMILGILALISNARFLFVFIFGWKFFSESLFIWTHARGAGWEVIERGGAYIAPLALLVLLVSQKEASWIKLSQSAFGLKRTPVKAD